MNCKALQGMDELLGKLGTLKKDARKVAAASVAASMHVLQAAAKAASPGTIGLEVGARFVSGGDESEVRGKVGLGVAGNTATRPHGHFLEYGTKYIRPRHFIADAIRSATPAARAAGIIAAEKRAAQLLKEFDR